MHLMFKKKFTILIIAFELFYYFFFKLWLKRYFMILNISINSKSYFIIIIEVKFKLVC